MQAATRIEIHRIFFCEVYLYLIFKCFKKWSLMELMFWNTFTENFGNMQTNVFSAFLIPEWKFLCRYFTGSAQKRKDILRFQHFPEAFTNVCLFLLRYKLAKQNSLLHRKQTPAKVFPVSFVRKQSKWRHFIKVAGLLLRFYKSLIGTCNTKFPEERL